MKRAKGTQNSRRAFDQEGNRITSRIRKSLELQEILTTTALEVRSLGTDRVKIYRFAQMEVEKSSQNPYMVVYPRYSFSC